MLPAISRLASTVAALVLLPFAFAAPIADEGQRIALEGNGRGGAPCDACHGPTGMGNADLAAPRLAAMAAPYLEKQLADYQDGTRSNVLMTPMAQGLTPTQRVAVARYYAALPVAPQSPQGGADPALLESGQRIAENGVWSKSVPPCYGCHGPHGEGIPPSFPAIVEQPKTYVVAQLTAWQQGKRAADPMGLMKVVASRLSSAEIDAVATWLASVQPPPAKK